ncbi:MAG: CpaF family protein [Dehalococcoidia bacterium]|nr:CpaF family protein [Dehalococcoidia bacterium]
MPRPTSISRPAAAPSASAELRQRLHRALIAEIDQSSLNSMAAADARAFVEGAVRQLIEREVPTARANSRDRLVEMMVDDVLGLGPLEPLLRDPTISEIMINGSKQVYIERKGKLHVAPAEFQDDAHVVHVIERILAPTGRTIDEATPLVDTRLPDGSRVNAVIPPATITGPLLTIRKFVADRLTADDLVAMGSLSAESRDILAAIVLAGLNIIVSGGTGSGKTTMLNVLSSWIPADERIVTIEDPAELSLRQPHVVRLEARPNERVNPIHQGDLLKNSLRMRPDRIIVGETRGAEAFDMLQAMNTGHDGSLSTIHANTPRDAVRRIENMVMMAGYDLPVRAIREQIASAIDVVIQISRMRDGSRRVTAISEVVGMEDQTVTMQDLFLFRQEGVEEDGHILGKLEPTGLRPSFADRLEEMGIRLPSALDRDWVA